ncbi:hypothetical protein MAM1_0091c04890 [Mucor ambiguus]|uniref:Homeobox domain-containing protein n=1 Tax=Mucor ambiguus TaxID=91626 RepID=A0A0C9MDM9_9FUNG|nr:hypothetical protein MAM1_0091c04890 [Mucor ambiguus]
MISVRSLLIDPQPQPQAQIHQPQQKQARTSVLDIASLLNDQDESCLHMVLSRQRQQQQNHSYYTHHYHSHHQANCSRRSPPISSHPYHSIDKHQRRSSQQHQIESKKIKQELLDERRQSSSSNSSSVYSSTTSKSSSQDAGVEDQDVEYDLPLKAKRRRASSKQLHVLNKVFERTFFPSTQLRAELGRQLGMSPRTVQIWFQNKRQAIRTRERSCSSRENSASPE